MSAGTSYGRGATLAIALAMTISAGCYDSAVGVAAATDAGLLLPDGGMSVCGDRVTEGREKCDDGNSVDTDTCRNDCTFPPICGDGTKDVGELCDDGNNHSGDGCSGACKTEVCGNHVLDPGEVCDGTAGCSAMCTSVLGCGDGIRSGAEQCDDHNTASWDGCSSSCQVEQATVLSEIEILSSGGCDLTGDGLPDALFGANFDFVLPTIAPLVSNALKQPPFNVLTVMGLEDPSLATDDSSVRVAWVQATDANGASPNFDGNGAVRVMSASLSNGNPRISFPSSIQAMVLHGGPEDVTLPFLMGFEIGVRRARIDATPLTVTAGNPPRVSVATLAGTLCGTISVAPFAGLRNILGLFPGGFVSTTSCDIGAVPTGSVNMADVLVGGASAGGGFLTIINGAMPDVDMDGDGLEEFVVAGTGAGCQRVITACIDGDGTMIAGHDCVSDPRMQDGWSSAFHFTAPRTNIIP